MHYKKCLKKYDNKNKENIPSPLILSGKHCIEGSCKVIVKPVEEYSKKGLIKPNIDNTKQKNQTPLEINWISITFFPHSKISSKLI